MADLDDRPTASPVERIGPLRLSVGQRARRTQTVTAKDVAPTYLGDTLTAEIEVLSLKPDKPVCQLRATITNQDSTTVLEGECWGPLTTGSPHALDQGGGFYGCGDSG